MPDSCDVTNVNSRVVFPDQRPHDFPDIPLGWAISDARPELLCVPRELQVDAKVSTPEGMVVQGNVLFVADPTQECITAFTLRVRIMEFAFY